MNTSSIACLLVTLIVTGCATSTDADTNVVQLSRTPIFALGQVGFIGHISQSEQHYRHLLKSSDALAVFTQLVDAEQATPEARLYAACGIHALAPAQFDAATRKLRDSGLQVSVLRTDILQREPVARKLEHIAQHGCDSAYWQSASQ
ncbi:MchS3 family protein [Herbaspirillum camelliae]|uniref:MchS3 family protein n=1 Tax=Herbaspirillum camelliae TaxID=1892903 RepID=UPI000949EBAB|nr:MchS3 family protein [Herbaspirillum camelliae]